MGDRSWRASLPEFNKSQRLVLIALDGEKYDWRTAGAIAKATGLERAKVDRVLAQLMAGEWVRPSISKKKNRVIFGLTERVGAG